MADPARAAAARNYLASIGVRVPAPSRRPVADVPGTLPGLADAYARPVELSAAEIERNAELARAREAAAQRDTSYDVSPNEMIRDLGIIAQNDAGIPGAERAANAIAGSGALRGALSTAVPGLAPLMALGDVEYDPVALASSAVPLADEAMAAGESVLGGRSYREAQAQREQQFAEARERSPGSAMVGQLAQGAVVGPAASGVTIGHGAAAGAALGGAGGYLGSEGEEGADRALAALRGAATGAAYGGVAGGLIRGGQAFAEGAAPGLLRTVGRGVAGGAAEGAGYGIGQGAIDSGGRIGSREQLDDALRGAAVGGATGGAAGLAGGTLRGLSRRARAPGLADDVAASDIDETLLESGAEDLAASPDVAALGETEDPQFFRSLFSGGSPDEVAAQRLRAAGVMDRSVVNRVANAFGGGSQGVIRAAEVARRSGISPPGEVSTLAQAGIRAARVRDASRNTLAGLHREIGSTGATMRGEQLAAPLEAEAARLRSLAIEDPNVATRIRYLDDLATDLRFGRQGAPQRAEYESLLAQDYADPQSIGMRELPEDVASLPGIEAEAVALPVRRAVQPQRLPYQAGRDVEREIADQLAMYDRPNPPAYSSPQSVLAQAHRSIVGERQAAGRAALGSRYESELMPANEAFRLAATIAPEGRVPNWLLRNEGLLRGSITRGASGGGPSGIVMGQLERAYTQAEPSINARLAEAMAAAPNPRIGEYADSLRFALPDRGTVSPALVGGVVGAGDRAEAARRTAESDRVVGSERQWEPTTEMLDEIDSQGLSGDEIDPALLDEIDSQGL